MSGFFPRSHSELYDGSQSASDGEPATVTKKSSSIVQSARNDEHTNKTSSNYGAESPQYGVHFPSSSTVSKQVSEVNGSESNETAKLTTIATNRKRKVLAASAQKNGISQSSSLQRSDACSAAFVMRFDSEVEQTAFFQAASVDKTVRKNDKKGKISSENVEQKEVKQAKKKKPCSQTTAQGANQDPLPDLSSKKPTAQSRAKKRKGEDAEQAEQTSESQVYRNTRSQRKLNCG